MEVAVDSIRTSAVHNLMNHGHYNYSPQQSPREARYPADVPRSMAMSHALLSPTTPSYPPLPYSHAHNPPPPPSHPASGVLSPPASQPADSRRHSDDKDMANNGHRMSLPSIHEALADPKPSSGYAPAPPTALPAVSHAYSFSQPPTPTTRPFGAESTYHSALDRGPRRVSPPQPMHPYARPEPAGPPPAAPASYDRQPSLPSIRTAVPAQSPSSARSEFPRPEEPQRGGLGLNGYSHPPPPPPHNGSYNGYPAAAAAAAGPGPQSATAYSPQSPYGSQQRPFAPRYGGADYGRDYPKPEPPTPNGDPEYMAKNFGSAGPPAGYGGVVKRNLDYYDIETTLHKVVDDSSHLAKVSTDLLAEAQRHSHRGFQSEGAPSLQEIAAMERQHELIGQNLRHIRDAVQQNMNERNIMHSGGQIPPEYEHDEMGQWSEEGKSGYAGPDSKKRRGRAAPPGRCHSCNRAETPEWRRGPDGARTLCNACGLHYAKLTRKNMGQQNAKNGGSSLRKMDDGSTRS